MKAGCTTSPIFYDIEASGLNGVPIEIGWAAADLRTENIQSQSFLIRPALRWNIETCWDDSAECVHGISLSQVQADGRTPTDAIDRLNKAFGRQEIFSDAPDWDIHWLTMIFDAADVNPTFSVSRTDAHTKIGSVARVLQRSPDDYAAIMEDVDARYPRTHRAAGDARHLAALWLAIVQQTR